MYVKARQLPKFNFLLAVINESYGEREKWVGKFYSKINCHVSCKRGKLQKKEAQRAKKAGIPNDNGESGS